MQHRLLVKARPGVSDGDFVDTIESFGGTVLETITQIGVKVVEFNTSDTKGAKIAALQAHQHFKFAEEDPVLTVSLTPNDTQYSSQTNLTQIGLPTAWSTTTGSGITIGIIDTGVDATHEDLADNMVAGYNFYDSNTTTTDVQGHGTAVAGLCAAVINNSLGIAGVAGGAHIMPLRVSDASGNATGSAIAKAITYAADHGCKVVNASFENVYAGSTMQSAAAYLQQQGGVLCVPSGNTGTESTVPATDTMVVVSSVNVDNSFSSFSTYGVAVQLCAPGNSVLATKNGGGYWSVWGTSFSSPTVAGVLALMFAANSLLTPALAMSLLNSTATDLGTGGRDKFFGYGLVNASAAVAAAVAAGTPPTDTTAPTVSIQSIPAGTYSGVINVAVTAADATGVDHVELYVNNVLYATDTLAPWTFTWDTTAGSDGTKTLMAKAYDAAGNVGTSAGVSVSVVNSDTVAPTVSIQSPANGSTITKSLVIKATASDAVGVSTMKLLIDGVVRATGTGTTSLSYSWNVKKEAIGAHSVVVQATDAAGNVGIASVTVTKA